MAFVFETGFELVCDGFGYPESPKYLPNGDIVLVDIKEQCIVRVDPQGNTQRLATVKGGPNGLAFGPDGKAWVANNGGFKWLELPLGNGQVLNVATTQPKSYTGGSIDRVDLDTGEVETVYRDCAKGIKIDGFGPREPRPAEDFECVQLRGPDDLVFDRTGGFWISDFGKQRERDADITGIYYAQPDGKDITEMIFPVASPNGIALSPKEDRLYSAFTFSRQVKYWELDGPGKIRPNPNTTDGAHLLTANLPGQAYLDSMAVDEDGNVYVALMMPRSDSPVTNGGIAIISPDGKNVDYMEIDIEGRFAPLPSSLCFGGDDRMTLYATCGSSGLLVKARVRVPGLKLNFNP